MAKVIPDNDRIQLILRPEEMLYQFAKDINFLDYVRTVGWKILKLHQKKRIKGRKFKYGDVQVIDGVYSITFYNEPVGKEPGGP